MKYCSHYNPLLLLLLPLIVYPIVSAFVVVDRSVRRIPLKVVKLKERQTTDNLDTLEHEGYNKVRAIECAEVFGRCSLEEVRKLRDEVHEERIKTIFLNNLGGGNSHMEDKLLEQRLLEEDLSLQLSLLQEEMPETRSSILFPMEATIHPEHVDTPTKAVAIPTPSTTMLNQNWLDALAIGFTVGLIAVAPHLFE